MLTHRDSVNFRYILLLNGLAAFVPGMGVQGRARDPLLHATWWTYEQHSAIIAVAVAAILGSGSIGLLMWRNLRRWWVFLFCGSLTGTFPSLFYLVVAPLTREVRIRLLAMLVVGVVWGIDGLDNLCHGRQAYSAGTSLRIGWSELRVEPQSRRLPRSAEGRSETDNSSLAGV